MPFNGSGLFNLLYNWQNDAAQALNISSSRMQNQDADIASGLSDCVTKDGQTTPTANLPMGGFRHLNVANAANRNEYAAAGQVQDSSLTLLGSVAGTDTITAALTPAITAYAVGQKFDFITVGANTTNAVTLNVNGLGAKNVTKNGALTLAIGDLPAAGGRASVFYDGTQFQLTNVRPYSHGAQIASAATVNLNAATGDIVEITGTVNISTINLAEGQQVTTKFLGSLIINAGANLLLPVSGNLTAAPGDIATWRGYAGGVVQCINYQRFDSGSLGPQLFPVAASVSGNALTITINPCTLTFRSSTSSSGAGTQVQIGAPITLTVPSGATLGTSSNIQAQLAILALNTGGVPAVGVVNMNGSVNLDETNGVTTTAISGSANSANVVYSAAAYSSATFRVVGFINIIETTPGTWSAAPTLVQGAGGLAFPSQSQFGINQTWQNTGGRVAGTTYFNTTNRPIAVAICVRSTSASPDAQLVVNGLVASQGSVTTSIDVTLSAVIPPGSSYLVQTTAGSSFASIVSWNELR